MLRNRTSSALLPVLVVATLAAGCGGGGYGGSPTAPPATTPNTVIVEIHDNSFVPQQVQINAGDTVRWVMKGSNPVHTVSAKDGSFSSGPNQFASLNSTYEVKFTQTGKTILYYCQVHGACCQMQGSVRVGAEAPPPDPGY